MQKAAEILLHGWCVVTPSAISMHDKQTYGRTTLNRESAQFCSWIINDQVTIMALLKKSLACLHFPMLATGISKRACPFDGACNPLVVWRHFYVTGWSFEEILQRLLHPKWKENKNIVMNEWKARKVHVHAQSFSVSFQAWEVWHHSLKQLSLKYLLCKC